ncbi:hypothetical protein F5B22DRAFT_461617 [Xylaria bambusicola]|uniref:uncharacterized protein n=1 Tax=Xylaria bambusicola TaxID=326684 RepID=UPI002007E370|nr:uncharacterized protein F5B22DRAFT_461617 [Xylaria bambusicola]KAI0522170.1 hypothetical protein F5B22DRAFT_461617 [Xylaria bambusicola]
MERPSISLSCRQSDSIIETTMAAHFTTGHGNMSSRRPASRANFSYPRLSRHESNESRSSNGSVPGMTDASDSDISFDDDGSYNTSAGELWDSFWPENTETSSSYRFSQESRVSLLQPRQHKGYLDIDPMCHQSGVVDDEAIKATIRGYGWQEEEPPSPRTITQPPPSQPTPLLTTPPRPAPKRSPVTYSVYPKPPVFNIPRLPHPPRTSSLSFEPPSPPRRPSFLRGSRSSAALRASKSTHNMHSLFIAPTTTQSNKAASSQQRSSAAMNTAASVPVSPVYPPPPTPRTLRPSTSAFNLRDKVRMRSNTRGSSSRDHVTAPPPQLLPSPLPEPMPTRPQFVSVFELDSDSDSETDAAAEESRSFARRWARGLHKRSTVEKRGAAAERKVSSSARGYGGGPVSTSGADSGDKDGDERLRDGGSLSRKRGGSLGRIFGFIGR